MCIANSVDPECGALRVPKVLRRNGLGTLLELLSGRGFQIFGPVFRDGAIVLDAIAGPSDFPVNLSDEQQPGYYRVRPESQSGIFQHAAPAHCWNRFLHAADECILTVEKADGSLRFVPQFVPERPVAFIGIHACDLAALALLERAVPQSCFGDTRDIFIVAVQCSHPASTCFCKSLNTGPRVRGGCDVALTELLDGEPRYFSEVFTDRGAEILSLIQATYATSWDTAAAQAVWAHAEQAMQARVDAERCRAALCASSDHARWTEASARCLACGNCTMACPTCFCHTIEDTSDLTGSTAGRWRRRDSCFSLKFSYIHGGSVRTTVAARYRQRVMHKFAYWLDQFGSLGCTGCGRCITWCPAGIDFRQDLEFFERTVA